MINKIGYITYRQINRISPSQFTSMKSCAYKLVLAEAFDRKYLLPMSPNAYMGSVLHKLLELIAKGELVTEEGLNQRFAKELQATEQKLVSDGYGFYVPLQNNVKDFGIKKIQLRKYLRNAAVVAARPNGHLKKYTSEKWFQSADGVLGGRIDLIVEENNQTEIIDFKSGAITKEILDDEAEAQPEIKDEYKDQLRLYAFLYFSELKRFPEKLSLVNLSKQKYPVAFTNEECVLLFQEAKAMLSNVNTGISTSAFDQLANPTFQNCKFCLYRPACSYYLKHLQNDRTFNDLTGLVTKITKFLNGNITIELKSNGDVFSITGFSEDRFSYLNHCENKIVKIFNLKKSATGDSYTVSKTTTIYE